jgi:hypothetical protein
VSQQQLETIQPDLDILSSLAQQLQPLNIAESQLRFLEVAYDELKANHAELADLLKAEADDEQQIDLATNSLVDQLQKIQSELPDLDQNGIDRVRNEALPAMQKQLDEINIRHTSAQEQRKAIERKWPNEGTTSGAAQDLINKIDETTSNQQEQILKIKLTLETIQLQIKNEFDLLMKQITEAENILNDPNSTIEQLQRSAEILAISRPKLEEIDRLYKDLDADNETSQELRKKTADKLFKLNELFRHNQKAADDRIEMIIQREHDQLSAVLNEGQQILNELPDSSENLGDFNQRHENAVKSAQNLLQQLPSQNSHAEEFSHLLDLATNMKRDIDDQVEKWNQLNKLCKEIADKQLKVEKAVNAEQEKGVQKLDDAQKTVKAFKVSF